MISGQILLNLLCSRARAAIMEATSDEKQSGPAEYYGIWKARMKLEMVGNTNRYSGQLISWSDQKEVMEVFLGNAILRNKYYYVTPFHKSLHRLLRCYVRDVQIFKESLKHIDFRCPSTDPSRIVDEYLDPWWKLPSLDTNSLEIADGLPRFIQQVCSHWWLLIIIAIHFAHPSSKIGDKFSYTVAPSFEARLRGDAIIGHLNSVVALNHLNSIVTDLLPEYVEGPEYEGGATPDDELAYGYGPGVEMDMWPGWRQCQ